MTWLMGIAVVASPAAVFLWRKAMKRYRPCTADYTHHWIMFDHLRARRCWECGTWQTEDLIVGGWYPIDYDPRVVANSLADFEAGRFRNAREILAELQQ